ncbi:MAG: LPS export ABC transporter permease LptF [Chromatiales bacterium 21-64-14]|nr:MAG: LPS export ABC transporter permease LptF [Chromatiales bacterium 21-64-14]HQU16395.1 LPS export ABC transporter permease LptF [Gammaproteobacteria bacterium]
MIIRRYLVREIALPFLVVTAILLVIFASHRIALLLADALSSGLSGRVVAILLGLKLIASLDILLPISLYLGTLIAFGRLYSDREMTVLAACGLSERQILGAVLGLAVGFAILVAVLSMFVKPWAAHMADSVRHQAESSAGVAGISPGRFHELIGGRGVVYVAGLGAQEREMRDIFVHMRSKGIDQVYVARKGYHYLDEQTGRHAIVLENGHRYDSDASGSVYRVVRYDKLTTWLQRASQDSFVHQRIAAPTLKLLRSTNRWDIAEFQWRLSMPLATVILVLLAVPLSRMNPRQGKYARVFTAILVYAVYYNLLGVAKSWVERGKLPVDPGLGVVHGLMLLVAIVLLLQPWLSLRWSRSGSTA